LRGCVRIWTVFDHTGRNSPDGERAGALKGILSFLAGNGIIQQDSFYVHIVSHPAMLEVIQAESICMCASLEEVNMD
jgi:hypothetical protein